MKIKFVAAMLAAGISAPALAQNGGLGVGVSAGSLGIGPEVNFRSNNFGVRGSATFFGLSRSVDSDGIEYDGDLKLRSFGGSVDFHPGGGGFRISPGARISNNRVELAATPTQDVEVGDTTYTPAQIGTISGEVRANRFAPTVTIGYGGGKSTGIYFGVDAGIMLQGSPTVRNLRTTGTLANDPAFQTQLAIERAEIENDVDKFKIYPILQLGLGYRF